MPKYTGSQYTAAKINKKKDTTTSSSSSSSTKKTTTSSSSSNKSSSSSKKTSTGSQSINDYLTSYGVDPNERYSSSSSSSNKSSSSSSSYKPTGTYFDAGITGNDKDLLTQYGNQYNAAKLAGDQAGMDAAHAAAEALRNKYGYSGGVDGSDYIGIPVEDQVIMKPSYDYDDEQPEYNHDYIDSQRPEDYQSKYNAQIDALLNEYLNRDKFSYDVNSDPLYEQYKAQYLREGNRAMNDAMASAAASAGGMNSYAMTAAQQANNYYNAQLTDKIPELYQLAYGMYLDDIDQQIKDLNILQDMDSTQYNRYRDTMADWRDDQNFTYNMYRDLMGDWNNNRNFAYGQYRDSMNDFYTDRNYQYGVGRDNIADDRYKNEWDYSVSRDQLDDGRYDSENAYNQALQWLEMGIMPSTEILAKAGISSAEAQSYINKVNQKSASTGGSTSRTGSTTKTAKTEDDTTRTPKVKTPEKETEDDIDWDSVMELGYGPIGEEGLNNLMASGEIKGEWGEDGKMHFYKTNSPFTDVPKLPILGL